MGWDEDDALIAACRQESELWDSDPAVLRARAEADVARAERAGAAGRAEIARLEAELSRSSAPGRVVVLPGRPSTSSARRVADLDPRVFGLDRLHYGAGWWGAW